MPTQSSSPTPATRGRSSVLTRSANAQTSSVVASLQREHFERKPDFLVTFAFLAPDCAVPGEPTVLLTPAVPVGIAGSKQNDDRCSRAAVAFSGVATLTKEGGGARLADGHCNLSCNCTLRRMDGCSGRASHVICARLDIGSVASFKDLKLKPLPQVSSDGRRKIGPRYD